VPKFLVTIEGGSFEVEADDEDDAIDEVRDQVMITADPVDDEDDDEGEADDEDDD
jgi:hypothetical protein